MSDAAPGLSRIVVDASLMLDAAEKALRQGVGLDHDTLLELGLATQHLNRLIKACDDIVALRPQLHVVAQLLAERRSPDSEVE